MPAIGEQTNRPITVRTRRRRRPPTRQEQASRAAETYYASQGRSVERQANRATSRQIMQGTREPPVPASRRGPLRITNERAWRAAGGVNLRDAQRQASEQRAARLAPGLAILNQLSRPVHGVAAGTRAAIHGRNVPRAALRGVELKDKSLFSGVLRVLGVRGPAASIGGFGLDVALDPTTYLSF